MTLSLGNEVQQINSVLYSFKSQEILLLIKYWTLCLPIKNFQIAAFVLGLVLLLGVTVMLYTKDTKTVHETIVVRTYFMNFCMENARYLSKEEFDQRFPKLITDPEWFYWPAKS